MSINNPIIGQVLSSDGDYLETFSVTGNVEGNIELTSVFESKVELGNVYSNADGNGTDYYSANYTFTYTGRHGEDIADSNARGIMNTVVDQFNVLGNESVQLIGALDDNNVRPSIWIGAGRFNNDPNEPLISQINISTSLGPTWEPMRINHQPNSRILYGLPSNLNPTEQRTTVQYWLADVEYANANVVIDGNNFSVDTNNNFANITSGLVYLKSEGGSGAIVLESAPDTNGTSGTLLINRQGEGNSNVASMLWYPTNEDVQKPNNYPSSSVSFQPNTTINYGYGTSGNLNPNNIGITVSYNLANIFLEASRLYLNNSNIEMGVGTSYINIPSPDQFKLQGGSTNQVLITDGSGNLTWGSGGGASVGTLQEVTGQGNTTTVNLTTANIVTNTDGNDGSGLVYGTLRNYLAGTQPRDGVAYHGSGGFLQLSTALRFPSLNDVNFVLTNHDHYASSNDTSIVSQRRYTTGTENPFKETKSLTYGLTDSTNNPVRANQSIHQELFTVQSDVDGTPEQQSVANYHHRVGNVVTIGTTDYQGLWANVTFEGRHGLSTSEVPNAKGIYNFENWDEVRINDGTLIAGTATIEKLEATSKINLRPHTVAELEAMSPIAGDKAMCSDSLFSLNSSSVGTTLQSGGNFVVPVYYDGLSWKIG